MNNNRSRGFILIELLVVISVIGLLGSMIFATMASSRIKARNAARIQTLKVISSALELYAANNDGNYPLNPTTQYYWSFVSPFFNSYWQHLVTALLPYANIDPLKSDSQSVYSYYSGPMPPCTSFLGSAGRMRFDNSQGYYLQVTMEGGANPNSVSDGGINLATYEILSGQYQLHLYANGPFPGWMGC